jgi:LacI family transcriptional regulator
MKKKLSIHDLAKEIGVSATAISFVINGKAVEKGISEELQKKILAHIKEVGYKPNLVAQSLRTGKTKLIGMMLEDISDVFFSEIARGVEINAYKEGYKIFYLSTEGDTQKTKELIRILRDRQVDGYIIAPPPGVEEEIQSLIDDDLPVILFDRYLPGIKTNNVVIDNFNGAFEAVTHLQKNGYKNIGFVTLTSDQTQMVDRYNGYVEATKKKRQRKYMLEVPYRTPEDEIVDKVKQFFVKNDRLDAVLFATNYLTVYGLQAIHSLQLRIPEDVAVVSFDDNTLFKLHTPSITAVAQPMKEISVQVVKRLMDCINGNEHDRKPATVVLPVELVVRDSSRHAVKMEAV